MPETLPAAAGISFTDTIEALSEGFGLFDADGRLLACNTRLRHLNPQISDLLEPGMDWALLLRELVTRGGLDHASAECLLAAERGLEVEGHPAALELELATGTVMAVTLAATRQGGFVLTQRDVTVRHRLEAEQREADQLLRGVLEACPANVLMSRLDDGQVLYRSPAATALLGTLHDTHGLFARREERADFLTALLPNGVVDEQRFNAVAADGSTFPAVISARVLDFRGDDVIVATVADLSGELALQAELAAQREAAFRNEKLSALGEMLAGVAHELNNPLSVVLGQAQLLLSEARDEQVRTRAEKLLRAADRSARIVRSCLTLARLAPVSVAVVDLNAVISTALEVVANRQPVPRVAIESVLAHDLPPVRADADQIVQVVVNLVVNADQAIAAAGHGSRVRVVSSAVAGGVELRIEDDGPGIPPAIAARVFEPFFTTKSAGGGTGIGLALCHRVVTAHGGTIALTATVGGGTTFTVRLPAAVAADASAPGAAPPPTGRGDILVVEDEDEVAELLTEILRRVGYTVDRVADGKAALRAVAARDYALLLSDLNMPGLDGRAFFAHLAEAHPALIARLAFITGDFLNAETRAFLESAGRPCLDKPIIPAELRALVARMLAPAGT